MQSTLALTFLALLFATPLPAAPEAAVAARTSAEIMAETTYYDHKQGVVIFTGDVFVDDAEYQLHADRAVAYSEGTNGFSRIVAIGHVALTNGLRRAFGAKASYHKPNRMIVLYSGDGQPAEVRDEAKDGTRSVRGSKIRFWLDKEQVEVVDSEITVPGNRGAAVRERGGLL